MIKNSFVGKFNYIAIEYIFYNIFYDSITVKLLFLYLYQQIFWRIRRETNYNASERSNQLLSRFWVFERN